jgi:hypothetical protein
MAWALSFEVIRRRRSDRLAPAGVWYVAAPRRLRLVPRRSAVKAELARLRAVWRRRLLHLQNRRRRTHRPRQRALIQAARDRARLLARRARDRERHGLGC